MKHEPYSWESTLRKLFYMNEKTIIVSEHILQNNSNKGKCYSNSVEFINY